MYKTPKPAKDVSGPIKTFVIIHIALLAGQVIFAAVAFVLNGSKAFYLHSATDPYLTAAPLIAGVCYFLSRYLFNKQLENSKKHNTVSEKLNTYKSAMIMRYGLLEGPSLFCIVFYLFTGNMLYLVISGLLIVYFMSLWPTKDKIADDLNLTLNERAQLDVTVV